LAFGTNQLSPFERKKVHFLIVLHLKEAGESRDRSCVTSPLGGACQWTETRL